jgi:hypothetical protein
MGAPHDVLAVLGSGGVLTPTALQSGGTYTAVAGELVEIGLLGSAQIVQAPASPSNGDRWGVCTTPGDLGNFPIILDGNGLSLDWGDASSTLRPFYGAGIRADFVYRGDAAWEYEPGNLDASLVAVYEIAQVAVPDAGPPVELFRFHPFSNSPSPGAMLRALYDFDIVLQSDDEDTAGETTYAAIRAQFFAAGALINERSVTPVVDERAASVLDVGGQFDIVGEEIVFSVTARTVGALQTLAHMRARVSVNRMLDLTPP